MLRLILGVKNGKKARVLAPKLQLWISTIIDCRGLLLQAQAWRGAFSFMPEALVCCCVYLQANCADKHISRRL